MKKSMIFATLLLAISGQVAAADSKYAIGWQSTFPVWGISGEMKIDDKLTAQLMLGPSSVLSSYAARGLYKFKQEKAYDVYGFGMLGLFTYSGRSLNIATFQYEDTTETAFGFGAGAGIEANWQQWLPEMPPVYFNLEIGFGSISFDSLYSFTSVMMGGGLHYRF